MNGDTALAQLLAIALQQRDDLAQQLIGLRAENDQLKATRADAG